MKRKILKILFFIIFAVFNFCSEQKWSFFFYLCWYLNFSVKIFFLLFLLLIQLLIKKDSFSFYQFAFILSTIITYDQLKSNKKLSIWWDLRREGVARKEQRKLTRSNFFCCSKIVFNALSYTISFSIFSLKNHHLAIFIQSVAIALPVSLDVFFSFSPLATFSLANFQSLSWS